MHQVKQHTTVCAGVGAGFKPAAIATGNFSSFITSTNGQVVVCGVNNYGQLGLPIEVCTWNFLFIPPCILSLGLIFALSCFSESADGFAGHSLLG